MVDTLITITDEIQNIAIGNIFVCLWTQTFVKRLCITKTKSYQMEQGSWVFAIWTSGLSITNWNPRKMEELGNSKQKHISYMQCPHHSNWACTATNEVESVDKHDLHIMDNTLISKENIAGLWATVFVQTHSIYPCEMNLRIPRNS